MVSFDGYEGPSSKDREDLPRARIKSADATVLHTSMCHRIQDAFLSNELNKVHFNKDDYVAKSSDSNLRLFTGLYCSWKLQKTAILYFLLLEIQIY